MNNKDPCILIKTALGMERVVAARVEELNRGLKAIPSPQGFKGLVLVYGCKDLKEDVKVIEQEVVEADRVIAIEARTRADLSAMAEVAASLAKGRISREECFAVRTVRRGKHDFTSIDVNVVVGDAVRKVTGSCVNLNYPDKIVLVEIIGDDAYLSIYSGRFEWKKMRPGKNPVTKLFEKVAIVQMPYLGPLDACKNMGIRIGREAQNFEVKELLIAPAGIVKALELLEFLKGVFEGIDSRYEVQLRSYHRKVRKVPVFLQDIHQVVRDRRKEPIIVFEPEGEHISKLSDELWSLFKRSRRVNLFFGSREGVPLGIYRYADLVIDIAPGITLSTEYAAASALIALATVLHEKLGEEG